MTAIKIRMWVPTSPTVRGTNVRTSVERWTWTRRGGLVVTYTDGTIIRSDYGTLRNFLSACATRREGPVRELTQAEIAAFAAEVVKRHVKPLRRQG